MAASKSDIAFKIRESELCSKVHDLTEQLSAERDRNRTLEKEIFGLRDHHDRLLSGKSEIAERNRELMETINNLESQRAMLLSDNEALTNQVSRQLAEGKMSETFADKVEGSHKRILKLEELLSQAESEKNSQTSEVTKLKLQLDYVKAQHQDERRMLEETSNRVRIELNRYNSEHRRSTDLLQAETRRSESKLVDAMAACASQVNDLKSNIERLEKIIKMKDRMLAGLSSKLDEASSVFAEKVSNLSRLLTEQTHETESLRHANTQLELKLFNMVESRSGPNGEFEDLKSELEKQKSDNMKLRMLSMQFLHRHIESVQ